MRTLKAVTGGAMLMAALVAAARPPAAPAPSASTPIAARPPDGEKAARRLCVGCHAFPPPDVLPRDSWRGVLEKMVLIVEGRGIAGWGERRPTVTLSPDYAAVLAYYEARAPRALAAPEPWPAPEASPRFVRRVVPFKEALTPEPAVSNVLVGDFEGDGHLQILACDMRQGLVLMARPSDPGGGAMPIAQIPHPAHVTVADLDGDGRRDLLVADLGEFYPGDHEKGAVTWLRARPGGGYDAVTWGGFPRVADVESGDFDADERPDILVAAFGWHRKGEIALLLNRTEDWSRPSFERVKVDARPGAIHVVPVDLDGDGKLDFVALLAQEHEAVVAFLGDGKGRFQAKTLYAAPHPNWGSSGIQLVDLDGDGDLDVLATNGDMFDDDILKPYHGVQWLENRGGLRFEPHPLAHLPGAHRAVAADLDGDGDLDIAVSAFTGAASAAGQAGVPSLVWLEQVKRGRFERRTIATGQPLYATLDVGDVDGDGDLDLVTGLLTLQGKADHWLEVWENQTRTGPPPAH